MITPVLAVQDPQRLVASAGGFWSASRLAMVNQQIGPEQTIDTLPIDVRGYTTFMCFLSGTYNGGGAPLGSLFISAVFLDPITLAEAATRGSFMDTALASFNLLGRFGVGDGGFNAGDGFYVIVLRAFNSDLLDFFTFTLSMWGIRR